MSANLIHAARAGLMSPFDPRLPVFGNGTLRNIAGREGINRNVDSRGPSKVLAILQVARTCAMLAVRPG